MKSRVRSTLLFVVLFVIATTSMFAATRAFDDSHINVTIQNAGPGGVVVIGSTVKVTLTDPEYSSSLDPPNEIISASVNFTLFGGIAADAMSWDPVLLKWKKDFTVQAGSINTITPTAKVTVRGVFRSSGESIIPDDVLFIVNNIAGTLSLLPTDIITTVAPAGTAIVGSTITVQFTSATITSASVNFASFGGPVTPMVKSGNTFMGSYTVLAGTIAGAYKVQIIGYDAGNPNPGVASDNDYTSVNNVLPSVTDILAKHLEVNSNPVLQFMAIGDTIHVFGTFKTTGATIVNKVWINWGATFNFAPIMEYPVVNGILNASYKPASGSLANESNLTISIVKMQTTVGNFATGIWNVSLNGAALPVPIEADLLAPSIAGVRDLWYDWSKPLRFSPVVTAVDGYTTQPNDFAIFLTIPNWGTADGVKSFTLRFISENREEFFRTYSFGDAAVTVVGTDLKVVWDGKNSVGTVVALAAATTYGITLWEIKDNVGNGATLSHIAGNEFSPTGVLDLTTHFNVQTGVDNWVGQTILNRIHVVADNAPLAKSTDLTPPLVYTDFTTASPIHLVRLIDDQNNSNTWNAGEQVYYIDASGATVTTLDFKFQLSRAYTVDTNLLRHEEGRYWAVMESGTSKWLYNGAAWVPYPVAFDNIANSMNVPFMGGNLLSDLMSFSWNTSNVTDFPGAVVNGTPYKLYAYFRDNAGNIVKSQEVNVKIEHRYYHIPIISDINIISLHDGGVAGLPPLTTGIENFYVTSPYTDGIHTGNYYTSQDILSFEVLINDRNYLRDNQAVSIQNTLGGSVPATIWLDKTAFVDNPDPLLPDRAVVNIPVANISKTSGAFAPGKQWTVGGPVLPNNYMKVLAYPLAANPFITNYSALGLDKFNLVVPEEPVWPSTNLNDYALTATPDVFSPGNPLYAYDAVANPANDNGFFVADAADETSFNFTIPYTNRNVSWTLKLERQDVGLTLLKSWTGSLTPAQLPYTPATPFNFAGLKDDLSLVTPALLTENLNLKLIVLPAPFGDLGYSTPPATVIPTKVVTIDNTNPTLVNGTGSSFAVNKMITLLPAQPTPVLTETQNQIAFTLHTSEYLDATILNQLDPILNPLLKGTGWNIQVLDSLGVALMNGATPVTATINNIVPSNGNKTFAITATLNGIAGTFTAKNAMLHIRLPWDKAKNPANYNNPSYPYNAAAYSNDSAEGFLTLHILNAKPKINDITFTNKTITGTAGFSGGTWNTALTQAWVRDGGTATIATNGLGYFTMVATVTGGAYRAMNTGWTANLQPLLGGAGTTNTAVVPVATSTVNPVNESIVWTLTWTGTIPATVASAWTHNQALTIPISIITSDGSNPAAHTETQSIVVRVDKAAPVASTTATEIVADGSAKAITFSVIDNPGSGVYWNTVVANPYGYVGESLVLSPNTGMTVGDTGNGTFTINIPATTTINKFTATYTASDHMGNQVVYVRYLNVIPKPKVKDVQIVRTLPTTLHVPGNSVLVRFDVENRTRVELLQIAFTGTGVSVGGGNTQTITLTPAEISGAAPIERTYNNVVATDASTLTATITGTVTQYTNAATGATTPPTAIDYGVGASGDNVDTILVDTKPVINSVVFKLNGSVINTLVPTMNGVEVVAVATTVSNLNTTDFPMTITMTGPNGSFNYTLPPASLNVVTAGNTRTYTWTNVSFANLNWTPAADYKVATFNFNCRTIHGYLAAQYRHDMAVLNLPTTVIQGVVSNRTPYNGTDLDGWFAPEHTLRTLYTFVTTVNATNPPITADFDLIEDNIVQNLQSPLAVATNGSTKTILTIPLTQGSGSVNATAYKYMAKWMTQPDVQSVWNAYDDGQAIPINFAYQQMTGQVADTRSIKVDKKVPLYETQELYAAIGTTAPGTYQIIAGGFPSPITMALNTNGQWPTTPSTQKIYLKYYAKDGSGSGIVDIVTPTLTGWTVAEVSQTPVAGDRVEKVISLTPTNPNAINAATVLNLVLAKVEDQVGHANYGLPVNSTDPAWIATGPSLTIKFNSNYLINPAYPPIAYQYVSPNWMDSYTAPYVRKGANIGFKMKLAPPTRGVDVANIAVSGIDLNTYYVTNAAGTGTTWTPLTFNAADSVYYLNTPIAVSNAYANAAGIKFNYRINYVISYSDGSTSPANYISQDLNNLAIVDAVSPVLNSVKIWSESLGQTQDGYVVVYDQNGELQIKFTDIGNYTSPTTVPDLKVTNLNKFVASRNGVAMVSPYTVPADAFTFAAGVWTASINNLVITTPVPLTYSVTIGYTVTDVVGNAPHSGNRMVEIVADGPIVPIIRYAKLVTTGLNGSPTAVDNYLAQGVAADMQVFIDTEHEAYIENVWVTPVTGVAFGTPTFVEDLDPANNYRWVAHIPVTPTTVNNYTNINFVVNTKRNPFGGVVFQDTETVPVIVDGNSFAIGTQSIVTNSTYGPITGIMNPTVGATITAEFNNIGELVSPAYPVTLPNNSLLASWFTLQNTTPVAFTNIPVPVVTGTGNNRTVVWTFAPADINQAVAANITQLMVNFKYKNVYGLEKTSANFSFNLDRKAPEIVANGIKFYTTGATPSQTNSYSATNYIANNQDWTKVRFEFADPIIAAGVNGTGVNNATVTLTAEAETYSTPALSNWTVSSLTSNYIELSFTNGFTAFDLAEGFYKFNISVTDNIQNNAIYTQRLLYWHSPSQIVINPGMNATVNVGDLQKQITAFPADPTGQVQGVHFHLYQDVNNNGTYQAVTDTDRTADLTPAASNPDMLAPYTIMWDLNANHYKYLVDTVYGRNATRKFLLRASALSEGQRSVTDSIVVVNVVDNQPPVPNAPTYSGNTTFDYTTPASNAINLVTTFAPEWIDAEWAIFEISKNGVLVKTINSLVVAGVADTTWNYNGQTPGEFTVSVKGKDFVGNISPAVNMALPVTINNPASLITYNVGMTNVIGFGNEQPIASGTVYGPINPVVNVGDLRLDAAFKNVITNAPSLAGISAVTFKAIVKNNVTGVETTVNVPNNTTLQPDYPATGAITVTPQVINNTITIFVPDSFFMPVGYESSDFSYSYFVELTPTNPANLLPANYSTIQLDYFAPRVTIADSTPNITWSQNNFFKVTGDIVDVNTVTMKWSSDNSVWKDAVSNAPDFVLDPLVPANNYVQFNNWNTAGGSENTLLNYAGNAWVKVIATDAMGNIRESAAVVPYIDNVAPKTPITHVAYRSNPDIEAQAPAGSYNNLHTLGSLPGEANQTITVISSTQDYGTTDLQLRVDPAQITNLSTTAVGSAFPWNNMASWYTGTNDFRPPLRLYHGYSATGDVNNISWDMGVDYDHETMNGMYGFDIPASLLQNSGAHYFIVGSNDTRGNVEGDVASLTDAFDGTLSAAEKLAAIDITVNVINVADVKAEIVSHVDNQIVGEWINLAANITENIGNVVVNEVRFERKTGNTWNPIATVSKANASNVKFHLYRNDIPQYDGLPYVPGVHLYANGSLVTEMMWDAATMSWSAAPSLTQGNYNFEYRLDLNNDGIISSLDLDVANGLGSAYIIADPNGFTSFNVTPWVTYLDTQAIPAGLYEFRAVPVNATGTALFNQVSPSRWLQIDNTAPNTTITLMGGVQRVRPVTDPVTIVADVNELLVATDDIVRVMYQYSSQPATAPIRRWFSIGTQTNMGGNYRQVWNAPAPLTDLVDNDNDGLVDEADEADAAYYLRAVAYDKAGNYFTSNVYNLFVDGSAPQMLVNSINGVAMNSTNNIFVIPATGAVTVTANNITLTNFDNPVSVRFEYQYKASVNAAWSGWQMFDPANQWVTVAGGSASQVLNASAVMEGYYGFRAIAKDILGNTDALAPVTYVVFNDVTGSNAYITSVGSRQIVSGAYGFAKALADYNGLINVTIDNPADINTITYEYAWNVAGPWTNIYTAAITGQTNVSTNWTAPATSRAPHIYLRVVAQDVNGNNASVQTVKLYIDTTAPGVVINSLTHTMVGGYTVLNGNADLLINLSYTDLPEVGLVDVASTTVKIINTVTNLTIAEIYTNVNQASQNFTFNAADMATLPNGIYRLEVWLTDFAGNTLKDATGTPIAILPAAYQAMYIDTMAPAALSIVSTNYPNNVAVYTADPIDFSVTYTDLIGIAATGAMTATFTYGTATDVVSTYTVDALNNQINFSWNPSTAFEQFITNGEMNIVVNSEVKVKDLLNNEATLASPNFFTLTYGIPNTVRMMAVTDVVNGTVTTHFVNWNNAIPQVEEMLGTNQTLGAVATPLELFAYVPHLSEIPSSVTFEYRLVGTTPWNMIGTDAMGDAWAFVDQSFLTQYQRQYSTQWDVRSLLGGIYEIKTTSSYISGNSTSSMRVNLYNGSLIPQVAVTEMQNGLVQRGETYTLAAPTYIGNTDYLSKVVYKYRYVTVSNNVVSPVSAWTYFGNENGVEQSAWISEPYTFSWKVYPYYLYNNSVQIVGYAMDKWGTETPISSIISNNAYQIAKITDTIAPAVPTITVNWNGLVNPAWLSGDIAPQASVMANITTNVNPNDLARVEFYYNDVLIATETGFQQNNLMNSVDTQVYPFTISADAAVVSGVLKVMAYDVYGNVSTTLKTINIDNTLPTANLAVTLNGLAVTSLERETTVLLNANAADTPAGVASVTYAYAYADANPIWIAIAPVEANFTANWLVPADLEYGHDYLIKATVTDLLGHVASSELTFEVSDINTVISIVSVAGHAPVNHIIPMRLHGDFPVVTNVPANQNLPRLGWYVRTADAASVWNLLAPVYVTELFDYTTVLNLDTMPSGNYYLGVGPVDRTAGAPVDQVMITLDNIMTINGITSIPATNGSFNGETFVVNFTIASDDAIVGGPLNQVKLSYAYPIDPTNWMTLGNANILSTLDGVHYTATFENISIMHNGMPDDGYYMFRLSVQDLALPTPNVADVTVATNVLYDVTLPNVTLTSLNGVTDMMLPINIDLGTTANIAAAAYDVLGGQTHQVASGIDKLEFYYNYNGNDVMISEDATAPYTAAWNTTGLPVGTYDVTVKAIDKAGNESSVVKTVTIGSPTTWQPFALVTAMNFDGATANQDAIYTVVDTWANETINGVTLEYSANGSTWTQFAQATNMGAYWKAPFNAELMSTVTQIRTVVNYNNNLISTNKPVLAVTYSAIHGGSLVVTAPTIMPSVYYNNEVRVTGAVNAPRVTTMFEDTYVGMPQVQTVNGNQTAFFDVPAHGEYNFWAADINHNTWMMQLNKATLNTHNIGTVASNGISTTVPANSFVYFETVMPTVTLEDGFTALSLQNAVLASPQQDLTYTVTLNAAPAAQGTIVGMYFDGAAWISVPATVNANNTVTFTAPSGYIYAAAQYTGVTINTMFVSVAPQYVTPANAVWTLTNTTAKFLVYTGMNQGGYETPLFGDFTYQMYLDNMLVLDNAAANYTDGVITFNATALAAGAHTARVTVTMDGFTAFAEKVFNVEITAPVIVATGTQLNLIDRTISATINDLETGIADAHVVVTGWGGSMMTIPMENLAVSGNVYSYNFTMDDLNALGYDVNYTDVMSAVWHASNNLLLASVSQPINYTVNIEGPAIAFTGFTGGWWLNPTFNTPLTFSVTVPAGRTMPADGVMIELEEVTAAGNNQIQIMTLASLSHVGNVYSYSLNFGQMLSPLATAVKLTVEAMDNYNVYNASQQTYGIDMAAPVVWAMAPIGAPIDNDGDGLFNEDTINGVNDDLDWVDLDQDGFWDNGEPQIVDEDPIDFMTAVIPQGTNVVVAIGFEDYSGFQYLIPGTTDWYFTGQSGINAANVAVSLNGSAVTGTITNGTFTYNAGVLEAGHYTVVASVPDIVGNVGSLAFEFNVVGGAPTITINALGDGTYWLNTVNNNVLTFTVSSEVQLANGGVIANIYTVPANTLLQGPMTLNAVSVNETVYSYLVNILGGLIPANQTGIRLEVIATDVWGGSSTANQVFGIDNSAPVVTITSPVENAQYAMNATVNIMATITDQTAVKAVGLRSSQLDSTKDRAGSGIASVILTVIDPDGEPAFTPPFTPENLQVITKSLLATKYGTYIINITATDGAGNQSVATRNFSVTPTTGATVTFKEIEGGWLNSVGMNNLGFTVNSPVNVSVTANVYTYPSEALLMGPLNVNLADSLYTVHLNGGMIPADQTSVRLQVIVTDQFGNVTEANNYYSVDRNAPTITILTPANGAEITLVDEATMVRIDAQFSDVATILKATSGSGIAMSKLIVIDPLGAQVGVVTETLAGITETTREVSNLMLGTYTVRVTVWDNAGNQAMASVNFTVVAIPAPPVNLEISDAHAYPNPMDAGIGARFSVSLSSAATLNVRIYDFAGREVRSMDYAGRADGKSTIEIVFDGRNNNGEKLARGTYFARVIANDGKKIVEKVVKIAIKK